MKHAAAHTVASSSSVALANRQATVPEQSGNQVSLSAPSWEPESGNVWSEAGSIDLRTSEVMVPTDEEGDDEATSRRRKD